MTSGGLRPRRDQVAELARGLCLPLPPIDSDHLKVIAEGLLKAFAELKVLAPRTVTQGSEAEVTALLEARLNAMIEDDPLWGQLVLCVARGKETLSHDGSHLEKRPDLSIFLSSRNRGFPLVVEAKIMHAATSRTAALYCDSGLRRFLNGEYAWGVREALMMAYVRDGSSIAARLTPTLAAAMARTPPDYAVEQLPAAVAGAGQHLAWSRHGRSFAYGDAVVGSSGPGSISVWHLWLT